MKRKTRSGVDRLALILGCLAILPAGLRGGDEAKAVVAGTVFRDPGFAFPRVQVTLTAIAPPPGVKKMKPMRVMTDARGEFAFHVTAGDARYRVRAEAPGFLPVEKETTVSASERVDVYLTLKPNAP